MTNLSPLHSVPDPELERPDLSDLFRLVETLGSSIRLSGVFRRTAQAIADIASDLEHMAGLVIDGECYDATHRQEWASCRCRDGRHQFRRDYPYARGYWTETKRDAVALVERKSGRGVEPAGTAAHLVTRIWATTGTSEVRS